MWNGLVEKQTGSSGFKARGKLGIFVALVVLFCCCCCLFLTPSQPVWLYQGDGYGAGKRRGGGRRERVRGQAESSCPL